MLESGLDVGVLVGSPLHGLLLLCGFLGGPFTLPATVAEGPATATTLPATTTADITHTPARRRPWNGKKEDFPENLEWLRPWIDWGEFDPALTTTTTTTTTIRSAGQRRRRRRRRTAVAGGSAVAESSIVEDAWESYP